MALWLSAACASFLVGSPVLPATRGTDLHRERIVRSVKLPAADSTRPAAVPQEVSVTPANTGQGAAASERAGRQPCSLPLLALFASPPSDLSHPQ